MARSNREAVPRRKEPGLLGNTLTSIVRGFAWLLASVLLSILIEWVGMVWWWPDEGPNHAKRVFASDSAHLHQALRRHASETKSRVAARARQAGNWVNTHVSIPSAVAPSSSRISNRSTSQRWLTALKQRYGPYLEAAGVVTQTVIVRLTLIVFSAPLFAIALWVGAVDGLVERDLRRWGGGRESSNVFNLARRSVWPSFVAACVLYLSIPVSLHPVAVLLPFAMAFGLGTRIACERLKKYF